MIPAKWVAAVLVLLAVLHVQVLGGPLLFDDTHAVVQNLAIRDLRNIPEFFVDPGLFSASGGRMYRPLVLTTLTLDHAIGGGSAWVFKLDNLLLHLLVCWLLLRALPRLFVRSGLTPATSIRAAVVATLVFGVHPLHVESLSLVSSRSEILAALGFTIALWGWLRSSDAGDLRGQCAWLATGTAVACLGKETGVLVPAVIFLVDWLLPAAGCRQAPWDLRYWLPRLAPAAGVALAYLAARKVLFGTATITLRALHTGGDPVSGGSRDLATHLESMMLFLPKAVALWLVPIPLSLDHTVFYDLGWSSLPVLAGAGFLLTCLALAITCRRTRPLLALAVLGAFTFALPWILVPLNVPLAEHRLYVPVLLFSLPVAALLARGWPVVIPRLRPWPWLAAGIVALLGFRSLLYQHDWLRMESVWGNVLRWNPRSFRAWCGLADAEIAKGNIWQAVRYLEKACAIYPRYRPAAQNRCEMRVRLLDECKTRHFADQTLRVVETYAEERWKDPFARLLAARARMGYYTFSGNPLDLRYGLSWALSCLAMVEPKMLVYRTAAEVLRKGQEWSAALALFDASEERGLVSDELLAHKAEILLLAGELADAASLIQELRGRQPFDPVVLGLSARLHARRDEALAWQGVVDILQRLGYETASLERPSSAIPKK